MCWTDKFFEILNRYSYTTENFNSASVAAHYSGPTGINGRVTFFGVNEPIPKEVTRDIVNEVFPLIRQRTGEISPEVISSGFVVDQMEGFARHCEIMRAFS